MDLYGFSLLLGSAGLATMALGGLGRHAHRGHVRGTGRGHHSHGTRHGNPASHARHHHGVGSIASRFLWTLLSPRVGFSLLIGLGATGTLLRGTLSDGLLFAAALTGGILFERTLVTPLWNFLLRFASVPAMTLDDCIAEEGRAVSAFDRDGHGLVALELDGQIVQLLATLRKADRDAGARVRMGDRVLIEDVDSVRNRCTVSVRRG